MAQVHPDLGKCWAPTDDPRERQWRAFSFYGPPYTHKGRCSYWGKMNWSIAQALLRRCSKKTCGYLLSMLEEANRDHRWWLRISKLCAPQWMYPRREVVPIWPDDLIFKPYVDAGNGTD